ncbi:MAG: family 20 glycosylhydrolase [Bacteroidetes bacterium]|nr:family 20 glycosylhydrolase [Bacteroidota bacterium]
MRLTILTIICTLFILPVIAQVDNSYNLMPAPSSIVKNGERFSITGQFRVAITGNPDARLYAEASRFIRRVSEKTGIFLDKQGYVKQGDSSVKAPLLLRVKRPGKLVLNENEAYILEIHAQQAIVTAETDLGAIHALETLMQLISADEKGYYYPGLLIIDSPRFAWRGILLDVALHFMPIDVIKRTLDGMAAVKMNVLHLHLCNDQGFRVESKVFPQLQQLSSDGVYFTQENIKEIIRYAGQRGIRIVPEFVVPAHTTAILCAFPELASVKRSYTLQRYFGVFDPVLDPTNEKVYPFLDKLFTEMAGLFPDQYFHIGGDENTGKDWENTPHIKAFMKEKGMKTFMELQTYFNKRILPIVKKNGKTMMGWDEILQPGVPKDIIIQSWRGKDAFYESIKKGYQAILSNGYYIDLIQPAEFHYLNDPLPKNIHLSLEEEKRVLGGEATMWSEHVTPETVDSRIWPRTAAIAERLWSPQEVTDVNDMYRRLDFVSLELDGMGLKHISYKLPLLRKLSNGYDTKTLQTLVDVIEPLKIYERNQGDTMYTVFSPYTKLADVATPDQQLPRQFSSLVDSFLKTRSGDLEKKIREQLTAWKENHAAFLQLLPSSPILEEGKILSENLSRIATSGLEALAFIHQRDTADYEWVSQNMAITERAKEQGGRCDLQVIKPIQKLIKAAGGNEDPHVETQGTQTFVLDKIQIKRTTHPGYGQ